MYGLTASKTVVSGSIPFYFAKEISKSASIFEKMYLQIRNPNNGAIRPDTNAKSIPQITLAFGLIYFAKALLYTLLALFGS